MVLLLLKWSSMEVKHRLLNFSNKVIYQNDDWFLFSLDSLLLANFVTLRKSDKKILDVTCGSRTIWFNKEHPAALYCDIRKEELTGI